MDSRSRSWGISGLSLVLDPKGVMCSLHSVNSAGSTGRHEQEIEVVGKIAPRYVRSHLHVPPAMFTRVRLFSMSLMGAAMFPFIIRIQPTEINTGTNDSDVNNRGTITESWSVIYLSRASMVRRKNRVELRFGTYEIIELFMIYIFGETPSFMG